MSFNVPINSIAPTPTPSDWVRPADWITITDTPNEVQFLVADTGSKCFTIRTTFTRTAGDIYIDWGDGVTDTISTTTTTNTSHVYSTGGTPCSRGYNTFKIRVYGDATCVITNALHLSNFAVTGGSSMYNIGLLEAYFGDNTCNTNSFSASYFFSSNVAASNGSYGYLEYVKLPNVVAWTNSFSLMFNNCFNLYKVVMPTSAPAATAFTSTFASCNNLRDISLPSDATLITDMGSAFDRCYNLRTVSLPTTLNSATSLNSIFNNCRALKNVTLPSINSATNLGSIFSGCTSLQWVRFNSLPSPVAANTSISFNTAFLSCTNLQNVYFPSNCSSNAVYTFSSTFDKCYNLQNILFPTGLNSSVFTSAFAFCSSLTNVVFQSGCPSLTSVNLMFTGCSNLTSVTLPVTAGATINMSSMFINCLSLPSITIPSQWIITGLDSAFSGCINIRTINLPNNAQNSCTTMTSMCIDCNLLENIVMPTSLNALTSLSSAFSNCYNFTAVTFPSTMNLVTTLAGTFNNCWAITNMNFPTSMPALTSFANTFDRCSNLMEVTLPTTVSTSLTNYSAMFNFCTRLATVTLPITQTSLITSVTSMFYGCGSLTSITNVDKIGSLTATPLVNGQIFSTNANQITSLSFNCPFSKLEVDGITLANFNLLNSLRLLNTSAGQWTGASPQIDVSCCDLSTSALNILFADIAAQGNVTSKTINITSCTGTAGLTAGDRLVLTSRGWTITG